MDMALTLGQRQGDLLRLTWDRVLWDAGRIRFRQAKTGRRLAVRITPAVEALLRQCRELQPEGTHVICKKNGTPYTSEGFRAIWQRYRRRWINAGNESFTFHDLRAMCATKCPSLEKASELLGHTTTAMTQRVYRRGETLVDPLA